jgi:hypothetical protein
LVLVRLALVERYDIPRPSAVLPVTILGPLFNEIGLDPSETLAVDQVDVGRYAEARLGFLL